MMNDQTQELIKECIRQEETCKYTSSSLYIWQKSARRWKVAFIIVPIILASIAGSQILGILDDQNGKYVGLLCGLIAGFFPSIYSALELGMRVKEIGSAASDFANLRDRFRQLANISSHYDFEKFNDEFKLAINQIEELRKTAPTAPESCFKAAQKKITEGHYDYTEDDS